MEPSSSVTFASSSSYLSNGSSPCSVALAPLPAADGWGGGGGGGGGSSSSVEAVSLNRLSNNLERLLLDSELDCSDADIDVADSGPPIPVHRCILAARSSFFHDLFRARASRSDGAVTASASATGGGAGGDVTGRPQYKMEDLVPGGRVGREAFLAFMGYLYTGRLRPAPLDVVSCADLVCPHDSCPPAIRFAVELMYAAWTFRIPELMSLFQVRDA